MSELKDDPTMTENDTNSGLGYRCRACSLIHETYSEAVNCYRSHTPAVVVETVHGDLDTRNLVKIIEQHIDKADKREIQRLYNWLRSEHTDE